MTFTVYTVYYEYEMCRGRWVWYLNLSHNQWPQQTGIHRQTKLLIQQVRPVRARTCKCCRSCSGRPELSLEGNVRTTFKRASILGGHPSYLSAPPCCLQAATVTLQPGKIALKVVVRALAIHRTDMIYRLILAKEANMFIPENVKVFL